MIHETKKSHRRQWLPVAAALILVPNLVLGHHPYNTKETAKRRRLIPRGFPKEEEEESYIPSNLFSHPTSTSESAAVQQLTEGLTPPTPPDPHEKPPHEHEQGTQIQQLQASPPSPSPVAQPPSPLVTYKDPEEGSNPEATSGSISQSIFNLGRAGSSTKKGSKSSNKFSSSGTSKCNSVSKGPKSKRSSKKSSSPKKSNSSKLSNSPTADPSSPTADPSSNSPGSQNPSKGPGSPSPSKVPGSSRPTSFSKKSKSPKSSKKGPKSKKSKSGKGKAGGSDRNCEDSSPTVSPGIVRSTPAPGVTSRCDQIRDGTAPTDGPGLVFTVDFILILNMDPTLTLERFENFLQNVVGPILAGCLGVRRRERRLVSGTITNVDFHVEEDNAEAPCSTSTPNTSCHHVDVDTTVSFDDANDMSYTKEELRDLLLNYCDDIKNIEGVENTFDPCATMQITGPTVAGAQRQQPTTTTLSAAAIVGVALAALFLILVFIFAIRRKRRQEYPTKHHSLAEDYDDSTYLKEDYDSHSSAAMTTPERKIRIVGEEDSLFSGLSGYPVDNTSSPRIRTFEEMQDVPGSSMQQDVHVCSSATCDVCEKNRQSGLQFIPVGMPSHSHESLPSDSSRTYMEGDTVDL